MKRRFGPVGYARVFGPAEDGGPALARKIIDQCGGHFRDLLYMLREVLLRANQLPVTAEVVDAAIAEMRNQFLPIAVQDARWLKRIADLRATALPSTEPEDVQRLTRFLDTHFVLYFKNHESWYDIHPLIRDEVEQIVQKEPPVV